MAVGGHPPTRPFRPFQTLRNRAYLSNHISSLTAPHFPISSRPPCLTPLALLPRGEGRGGKGREGKKCFCRPHNRQFFQHVSLFGRFSAERNRTPPPNPDVSVSNAPFSPRNSFSSLISGRKHIFDPTFGHFPSDVSGHFLITF